MRDQRPGGRRKRLRIGRSILTAWCASGRSSARDTSFTQQPKVANGASELLLELFGDAGKHVRAAVGVNTLPLDASVEIEFIFEVR